MSPSLFIMLRIMNPQVLPAKLRNRQPKKHPACRNSENSDSAPAFSQRTREPTKRIKTDPSVEKFPEKASIYKSILYNDYYLNQAMITRPFAHLWTLNYVDYRR